MLCLIFVQMIRFLELFKELCRHYYGIYPEMITDQINAYREVCDTNRMNILKLERMRLD